MLSLARNALILVMFTAALGACGRRGALELPPGSQQAGAAKAQSEPKRGGGRYERWEEQKLRLPGNTAADDEKAANRSRMAPSAPKRDLFIDGLLD